MERNNGNNHMHINIELLNSKPMEFRVIIIRLKWQSNARKISNITLMAATINEPNAMDPNDVVVARLNADNVGDGTFG
jgi:transcriptional regulator of aromatic amino acid metabolism